MREMLGNSFAMMQGTANEFQTMKDQLMTWLLHTTPVHRGTWQSEDVSGSDGHSTHELPNVVMMFSIPATIGNLQDYLRPDLPWAENHFQERVSGKPLNPPPSYVDWPYHSSSERDRYVADGLFSHTYPERMWPKRANPREIMTFSSGRAAQINTGIRFAYGDLRDVVDLLRKHPRTRQAYLPIFFPEDTGAAYGQRIPCTLGYHFIRRGPVLDCNYFIRSCDVYRHFTNDAYMAARLCQWMVSELTEEGSLMWPGNLNMHISNLHLMRGDAWRLDRRDTTC